jgi:hypothetical protein
MMQYVDFTITLMGQPGAYLVAAQGPREISVPPTPAALDLTSELSEEIERIAQGYAPTRQTMQMVGAMLYDAIFPRRVAKAFNRSYEDLPQDSQLRLRLAIHPPELNRLPWELLFDPDEEIFLAARLRYPMLRYIESIVPAAALKSMGPLQVLYVQAQPQGMAALNLEASEQALRAGLGEQVEVTVVRNCTPEKLREQLREAYHILHYDGHASFDVEKGEGSLCLEDEQGGTHHVSGELLATYLDGTSVRLVVLAACESGMDSPRKRFSGIAQQIMKSSSLPAVVAMQFAVVDGSAIAFNKGFYSGLAGRMPVEAALVEGRKAILETVGGDPFAAPDWATPVLFMRTRDGNLFVGDEEEAMAEKDKKQDKPSISFGKGATISGDFVVGNKTSVKTGNISASGGGMVNVAGGNIQQTIEQTTGQEQPLTRQDFERLMVEIHKVIEKAGLDSDTQEEAAGMLQKAQSQAAAPQPNKALIETRLKGIVELVTAAGGAASALQQLAPLVQKAIETVGKLF